MTELYLNQTRPVFGVNGGIEAGAKVYFYLTGTTTKTPIYADAALTTELPNPVVANAAGVFPSIYLDTANVTYRAYLTDASDVELSDVDPYYPGDLNDQIEASVTAAANSASAAATDAEAVAADKVAVASDKSTVAADKAVVAGYVTDAEAARDAAIAGANIYTDTTAGIASVADGAYFQIPSAQGGYVDLYQRNGATAIYIDTLPNFAAQRTRVEDNRFFAEIIADDQGHILRATKLDGTTIPVRKTPLAARMRYDLSYVPFYGQSLSLGGSSIPVLSSEDSLYDFMWVRGMRPEDDYHTEGPVQWYASIVPAKESVSPRYATQGETPARGFADAFHESAAERFDIAPTDQSRFMLACPGQGGIEIVKLLKGNGTGYYERIPAQMAALASLQSGVRTVGCETMPLIHGERDYLITTTKEVYKGHTATLVADITADAQAAFDQDHPVAVIATQVASHIGNANQVEAQIALAQFEMHSELANYYLACPMYPFPFSPNNVHTRPLGGLWFAAHIAKAHERLHVEQVDIAPLQAIDWQVQGNKLTIEYDVRQWQEMDEPNALRWNNGYVNAPVAEQPHKGFRCYSAPGNAMTISSVEIVRNRFVEITCTTNFPAPGTGAYWDYARQGGPINGAGNLSDRQGDYVKAQKAHFNLPLDNWALIQKGVI